LRVDWCDIIPHVLNGPAGHLIKVALVLWHPRLCVDEPPLTLKFLHFLLGIGPIATVVGADTIPLVRSIAALLAGGQIPFPISASCTFFDEAVVSIDVFAFVRLPLGKKRRLKFLGIEKDNVVNTTVRRCPLLGI
jgi:hypothetical protein